MGYAKISNLYKRPDFLKLFREVYVSEKLHGTSCNISFESGNHPNGGIQFFSGGADHSQFCMLFDKAKLLDIYRNSSLWGKNVTLYGEGVGGKLQAMSHTYGKKLSFVVFDVKVDDKWLDVPEAQKVAERFQQEFVWYTIADNTIEELNRYRDQPSELAKVRGCGDDKPAEGIVVKPLYECYDKNGGRWYVKHKRAEFCETTSKRETVVDPDKLAILAEAESVAGEWVTNMRLEHVLDKLMPKATGMEDTGRVIRAMQEDIRVEAGEEIDWRMEKDILAKIARNTAKLWKEKVCVIK